MDSNQAKLFAESLKERADNLAGDVGKTNTEFEELVTQARTEEKSVKVSKGSVRVEFGNANSQYKYRILVTSSSGVVYCIIPLCWGTLAPPP